MAPKLEDWLPAFFFEGPPLPRWMGMYWPWYVPSEGEPQLYEHYNAASNLENTIYADRRNAQTFTPSVAHSLKHLVLELERYGSPGPIEIAITGTVSEVPDNVALSYLEYDGNSLPESLIRVKIEMPGVNLESGVMYAIEVSAPNGDISNRVDWGYGYPGAYGRGAMCFTEPGSPNWNISSAVDLVFEEWGIPL